MPFVRTCHGCPAEFGTIGEVEEHLRVEHPGRGSTEFSSRFVPMYDALHGGAPSPRRDIYCSRCGARSHRTDAGAWVHDDGSPICVDPESLGEG